MEKKGSDDEDIFIGTEKVEWKGRTYLLGSG